MGFEQEWNQAPEVVKVVQKEYKQVPTGTYNAVLVQTNVDLSADDKNRARLRFKVTSSGEFSGLYIFASFNLYGPGLAILKKELSKTGVDLSSVKSLADMEALLKSLENKEFDVYAKMNSYTKSDGTTGTNHNVYINKVLSNAAIGHSPQVMAPSKVDLDKDVLPF